jgi:RNA polymerase sigma factor (sigma-70 family)
MHINFHQQTNDEQLFCYLKNDDPLAFKELYNRYWSFLLDAAYKTLQTQDKAEDVVQEIFISLYQRRKSIVLEVSLKAYLCKALKFKVLNELRSKTVRDNYQKKVFFQANSKNDFTKQEN